MADNPNAFKHWIGRPLLVKLAAAIGRAHPQTSTGTLRRLAPRLEPLELKDRVRLVRDALHDILPPEYPRALDILLEAARDPSLKGFDFWPFTEFVQTYGLEHFDRSMGALHLLTQRFTAEFAVRPFLKHDSTRTFARLQEWAGDPNHHVRRCASEGTRPRLPWGERVTALIEDPAPGLAVIEALRFDPELYVRRSVANHLNDVAKDHPRLVCETLRRWRAECPAEQSVAFEALLKHAVRGLVKRGDREALALIGVGRRARVEASGLTLASSRVSVGGTLQFEVTVASTSRAAQKLVVDYVIGFRKANGQESTKVFKLKTFDLPGSGRVTLAKRHSLRPITTRVYYPGAHRLAIQVNGVILAERRWHLTAKTSS
jgi:3-methyladenine DNA glycosylase AlkC